MLESVTSSLDQILFLFPCYISWIISQILHIPSKFKRTFFSSHLGSIYILAFIYNCFVLGLYSLLILDSVSCVPYCPHSHYVAKCYLELIFLPPSPMCWGNRHGLFPCSVYVVLEIKPGFCTC